ncbi:ATPases of the AAA+ class [Methanocella conradii HZ254]|uniref:ATPases of the AAA+ class n=1 Tax=Methanocella conradii (strain DSM 24694 / JCM 17849 / CGMCC 1.5162 / HZ254) TaxID=1041930 RepID=H8I9Q2_METCZ|nr:ATP-binding protein [Methanocella conradii]AFD00503.1 ATPases of the AAA+ class [Methanocella conradii HZ254]MDI6896198.1 ATP-binding protein [Methanocella conradii]
MANINGNAVLDVLELLLTAEIYNNSNNLDEDDLPPRIRKHYWDAKQKKVNRPIKVVESDIKAIYGLDNAKDIMSSLPFVNFDEFGSIYTLTVLDLGTKWFAKKDVIDRINNNPVLAYYYQNYGNFNVDYKEVRARNPTKESGREWIDGLSKSIADEGAESMDMLKLVHILAPEEIGQKLDDIILTAEQEAEVEKIVKAIQYRDYLRKIGLREIGKLLFVGPPGTGKTSTARAMSARLKLPFLEVKLSMITSQYLGETSKNIDKVFELAKKLSPCILFIDEFDFVAKTRTSDEHAAIKRAVNTLLKCIDEISLVNDGVLLIGATNHPKLLDNAVWRRFDEIVMFPLPDREMRKKIFELVLKPIDGKFDIDALADRTENYAGSDLRLIVREAVLNALTEDRTKLTQEDMLRAVKQFEERINLRLHDDQSM